jgi:hypothetical protein
MGLSRRELDRKDASFCRDVFKAHPAPYPLNDGVTDPKAQAHSFPWGLGGEKGFENVFLLVHGDPGAAVRHLDHNAGAFPKSPDLNISIASNGIQRIGYQVQEYLLQF